MEIEAQRRVWWVRYEDFLFLFLYTLRMEETKTKRVSVAERQRNCIRPVGITYIPLLLWSTLVSGRVRQFESMRPGYLERWALVGHVWAYLSVNQRECECHCP